jgi:hypothetical protein
MPGTAAGIGYPTSQAVQRIAQDSQHQSSEWRAIILKHVPVVDPREGHCLSSKMSFSYAHHDNPSRKGIFPLLV